MTFHTLVVQRWMSLDELFHFAVRAPAAEAIPRIGKINMGDLGKPPREIELTCALVRDRLAVRETAIACRTYGRFIQVLGVKDPALDTRDFGTDERGSGLEVRRTMQRPYVQLTTVLIEPRDMRASFCHGACVPRGGVRQRGKVVEVAGFYLRRCRPQQAPRVRG